VRSSYLFLAFDRARDLAIALDLALDLDLDLARALDLARVLDRALDRTRTRALDLDLDLDRALDLALDLDLDPSIDYLLHIALQMSLIFRYGTDYEKIRAQIPKFKQFFSEVVKRRDSLNSLSQALRSLAVPDSQSEWEVFTEELRSIMQRERNIGHEWNLTKKQVETLETYLRANILMVDCLKLAAVSDRKAIENSVLLPPVV